MVISDKAQDPDWLEPEGWLLEHHPVTSSPTNQRKVPHPGTLQPSKQISSINSSLASPQHSSASAGVRVWAWLGNSDPANLKGTAKNKKTSPHHWGVRPFWAWTACSCWVLAVNLSLLQTSAFWFVWPHYALGAWTWIWQQLDDSGKHWWVKEGKHKIIQPIWFYLYELQNKLHQSVVFEGRIEVSYLWGRERRPRWERTQIAPGVLVTFCFSIWLLVIWICLWKFFMTIHFWLVYTFYMCHTSIKRFLKIPLLGLIWWSSGFKTLLFQCRGLGFDLL